MGFGPDVSHAAEGRSRKRPPSSIRRPAACGSALERSVLDLEHAPSGSTTPECEDGEPRFTPAQEARADPRSSPRQSQDPSPSRSPEYLRSAGPARWNYQQVPAVSSPARYFRSNAFLDAQKPSKTPAPIASSIVAPGGNSAQTPGATATAVFLSPISYQLFT